MSLTTRSLFASVVLAGLAACSASSHTPDGVPVDEAVSDKPRNESPSVTTDQIQAAAQGEAAFAVDVYNQLAQGAGNIFFSPHSVALALMMVHSGARGDTAAQMRDVMHLGLPDDQIDAAMNGLDLALASRGQGQVGDNGQPFALNIADAVWGQSGFQFTPAYLDTLAVNYGAGLNLVDFAHAVEAARVTINDWVAGKTNQKILDLIPQGALDSSTRLVLTNAVYFNASWKEPFVAAATVNEPFHAAGGTTVSVPTMVHASEVYRLYQASGVTAVSLPYAGDEISMIVIHPDDLTAFEASLTPASLQAIFTGLGQSQGPSEVNLHLPKWKLTATATLSDTLTTLGMTDVFEPSVADLSGIDGARDLYVQTVIHKAYISVDEKGTEAAAATAIGVGTSAEPQLVDVKIDSPFLVLIRDDATGAIVFFGRELNPADEQ